MSNQQMELVVFANSCTINLAMKAWLEFWHITPFIKGIKHSLVSARNEAVRDFLARDSEATHLILMDENCWPNQTTNSILSCNGDVIYLGHIMSSGTPAHFGQATMGTACCRFSREALEAIEKPWFQYEYDNDGIEWTECECEHITKKLTEAGYPPKMVGVIPHEVTLIAEMGPNGMRTTTREKFLGKFV